MILDSQNLFDTSSTALTSTRQSTNIIDLSVARDMGIGDDPALKVRVQTGSTAFASTGSSTLVIAVQGSTDNSTWDTYQSSPSIAKASMAANTVLWDINLPRPFLGFSRPRYLRLNFTVGTADFTAGGLTAWMNLDNDQNIAYPPGVVVSN